MAIKNCVICGAEFTDYGRGKYCKGPHYTNCEICGTRFEYNPLHRKPKTCSTACRSKLAYRSSQYRDKICPICGKVFHLKAAAQKFCEAHN